MDIKLFGKVAGDRVAPEGQDLLVASGYLDSRDMKAFYGFHRVLLQFGNHSVKWEVTFVIQPGVLFSPAAADSIQPAIIISLEIPDSTHLMFMDQTYLGPHQICVDLLLSLDSIHLHAGLFAAFRKALLSCMLSFSMQSAVVYVMMRLQVQQSPARQPTAFSADTWFTSICCRAKQPVEIHVLHMSCLWLAHGPGET